MKALKRICLLMTVLALLCSCSKDNSEPEADTGPYRYNLRLSVQDVSGNDLVKGIGYDERVDPDLYTLEVVFPDRIQDQIQRYIQFVNESIINKTLILDDNNDWFDYYPAIPMIVCRDRDDYDDGYYHLGLGCMSDVFDDSYERLPIAEKITFKLRCPYIFGDNVEHDIVTYWYNNPEISYVIFCSRVEIENKVYTPQLLSCRPDNSPTISDVTIILGDD